MQLLTSLWQYISKWHTRSININNSLFLILSFLLVLIALNITKAILPSFSNFRVSKMTSGTFGVALRCSCSGISGSLMQLSCSISYSMSASQLSSLSCRLSKWLLKLSQFLAYKTHSCALSLSISIGWHSLLQVGRTSILELIFQGGPLQINLVAKGLVPTM